LVQGAQLLGEDVLRHLHEAGETLALTHKIEVLAHCEIQLSFHILSSKRLLTKLCRKTIPRRAARGGGAHVRRQRRLQLRRPSARFLAALFLELDEVLRIERGRLLLSLRFDRVHLVLVVLLLDPELSILNFDAPLVGRNRILPQLLDDALHQIVATVESQHEVVDRVVLDDARPESQRFTLVYHASRVFRRRLDTELLHLLNDIVVLSARSGRILRGVGALDSFDSRLQLVHTLLENSLQFGSLDARHHRKLRHRRRLNATAHGVQKTLKRGGFLLLVDNRAGTRRLGKQIKRLPQTRRLLLAQAAHRASEGGNLRPLELVLYLGDLLRVHRLHFFGAGRKVLLRSGESGGREGIKMFERRTLIRAGARAIFGPFGSEFK